MKELPSQMGGGGYSQKKVGWGWGLRWIYSQFWFKRKKGRGGLTRCDDIAWNQRYLRCKMSQKTGGTCTEMWSYSCKDIICIKCFKTWSGVHFVQSSLQIYYFKYKNIAKNGGGGHFVQNSQFIIYKDIILGIKLIGPNLISRIDFCFTCYPMYTQFEAHFWLIFILEDRF